MGFEPGTIVGRYEIESLIAVGGMGEVYRARDHELHRSVALKFLSQEFISNPPEFNAPMEVQIVSSETGQVVKSLPAPGDRSRLSWSPDGKSLDYVETREGVSNLMRLPLDGGKPRQLTDWKSDLIFWFAWSADGRQLACARGTNLKDLILMEDLNLVQ